jgi:hypothetical protein
MVTIIRVKSAPFIDSIMKKSHCRTIVSADREMCSTISSADRAHTQRAKLHSNRECLQESARPQIEQAGVTSMFLWCRRSPVDRDSFGNLHRKILTFDETSIFHILDQSLPSSVVRDEAGLGYSELSQNPSARRILQFSQHSTLTLDEQCSHSPWEEPLPAEVQPGITSHP